MNSDYSQLAVQFGQLFGLAQGDTLKVAHMTRQGMELVFEGNETQTVVRISPQVYTEGKVIIDAINDLTMRIDVTQYALVNGKLPDAAEKVGGGTMELPFSTWFFEGDYM